MNMKKQSDLDDGGGRSRACWHTKHLVVLLGIYAK